MLTRLTIILPEDERVALQHMSETDCRYPREQMRYLLREEACRRGLLSTQLEKREEAQDGEAAVTGY